MRKGWGELAGGREEFDPETMERNERLYENSGKIQAQKIKWAAGGVLRKAIKASGLDLRRQKEIAILKAMPYDQYLDTDWWKHISRLARERDGHECRKCGSRKNLDVHHLTYERRGEERTSDLITLCRRCHDLEHGATTR